MSFLKPTVLLLFVAGFFVSTITMDMRPVFFAASAFFLLAFVSGFLICPRLSMPFVIDLPVQETLSDDPPVVLRGEEFRIGPWPKLLIGNVKPARLSMLMGYSFVACWAIYLIVTGKYAEIVTDNFFVLEGMGIYGCFALLSSITWLEERWILRKGLVRCGWIISRSSGLLRERVTYNFMDDNGERRGGIAPVPRQMRDSPQDNTLLIVYDQNNPDTNVALHGMMFHRIFSTFIPAPRMAESTEQVS